MEIKENLNADYFYSRYLYGEKLLIRNFIHNLKYKGFKNAGIFAGELIGREIIKSYQDVLNDFNLMLPVPLHHIKYRERGYNQSLQICRGIQKYHNIPIDNKILRRVRNTQSQSLLPPEKRKENVKDAFEINFKYEKYLKNKKIIIVDDIITTGSTLTEIINELKKFSVSKLFVITFAATK